MNKYIKYGIIAIAVIVAFGLVASMQFQSVKEKPLATPSIQEPAPEFTLKNINGASISLKDYQGETVYIKFWASWCKDCIKEVIPQRKLEHEAKEVKFINISIDDSEIAWKKAVIRNKLSAEECWSVNGESENINTNYGISEIPRYIIVGKDGKIINNNAPHPSEIDANYFAQFN